LEPKIQAVKLVVGVAFVVFVVFAVKWFCVVNNDDDDSSLPVLEVAFRIFLFTMMLCYGYCYCDGGIGAGSVGAVRMRFVVVVVVSSGMIIVHSLILGFCCFGGCACDVWCLS
jgi:hypothetical protein